MELRNPDAKTAAIVLSRPDSHYPARMFITLVKLKLCTQFRIIPVFVSRVNLFLSLLLEISASPYARFSESVHKRASAIGFFN
jgi:hypothetical protein